jgi:hypothetical protein
LLCDLALQRALLLALLSLRHDRVGISHAMLASDRRFAAALLLGAASCALIVPVGAHMVRFQYSPSSETELSVFLADCRRCGRCLSARFRDQAVADRQSPLPPGTSLCTASVQALQILLAIRSVLSDLISPARTTGGSGQYSLIRRRVVAVAHTCFQRSRISSSEAAERDCDGTAGRNLRRRRACLQVRPLHSALRRLEFR